VVTAVTIAAGIAALCWLGLALHPARPWDLRPRGEDEPAAEPDAWPTVAILVPAHDEAAMLPVTLPALAAQDYPGRWHVVVVDDRSSDGTAAVARGLGLDRVRVVDGRPLPDGWAGKVWAMAQAVEHAGGAEWVLLTDADIRHAPGSLRRLVADALAHGVVLDSRMARLRTETRPERLLIPAFAFFFACLYPMRWVGRGGRQAAAAGGCILVRRDALSAAGGLEAIRGEVIDDVNLAQAVARHGRVRLATSRDDVVSLREYDTLGAVWHMVRRTAFDQLGYSWALLALTVVGLLLLFVAPLATLVAGLATGTWLAAGLGLAGWLLQTLVYLPAVRHFGLSPTWALALPLAGVLYGGMSADSAVQHARGTSSW
jgi:hopene-associated glycosyltransferase HpnB